MRNRNRNRNRNRKQWYQRRVREEQIPFLSSPSPDEIHALIKNREPVVFDGLMKDWRAQKHWSLDYFKQILGEDEVKVKVFQQPRTGDFPHLVEEVNFLSFLELWYARKIIDTGPSVDIFLGNQPLELISPALVEDVKPFPVALPEKCETGRLWIGCAGHHSHLHYDEHDGLLCCIEGKKEVWLYEPLEHLPKILVFVLYSEPTNL
eukprot:TRINITY_DN6396_c0_g1_i3.p1 TRINITY_DN6396_c0_g1~~TRINITY_DN6396_c0_g1_i3.p1  ORF type:complete len:206 (-),score=53.60 TRINITY_DN6396_c0_g1_i3:765-1382(-)